MESQENKININTEEQPNKTEISSQNESQTQDNINKNPNNENINVFTKPNERIKTKVHNLFNNIFKLYFIFSMTGCNKCKRASFRRL